ncbi:MAG: putative manganese-dependent inorganic diphosphatase [bacterium]
MSTIIIGHKNPDTDSICSCLAYACFKRQVQGEEGLVPARCGNINPQTQFVLDKFNIDPPAYIGDLYIRAKDLMTRDVVCLSPGEPLRKAVEIFKERDLHFIPVSADSRKVQGILTFSRIARHILQQENFPNSLPVSVNSLLKGIKAKLLAGESSQETIAARILVGAMEEEAFSRYILQSAETALPIVIVGDRSNIQKLAVELGVYALVVCGGAAVREDILALAREKGVYVLLSPSDTASTALLARLATPVGKVADPLGGSLKPEDRFYEIRERIVQTEERGLVVLDDERNLQGIITRTDLLKGCRKKVILVDHNEKSQAIDGIEEADLVEIVDHHRLGDLHTIRPIRFINEPLGSTCTIIAQFFHSLQKKPAPEMAGLLLSGILSDTMLFKSPTTTPHDQEMASWLGEIAGLDTLRFGNDLFAAGSSVSALSVQEIINNDFKVYDSELGKFGIGQVEIVGRSLLNDLKEDLLKQLQALTANHEYLFSMLMISDVVKGGSYLLYAGKEYLAERLGYDKVEPNLLYAKGMLSRKKQLVPHVLEILK